MISLNVHGQQRKLNRADKRAILSENGGYRGDWPLRALKIRCRIRADNPIVSHQRAEHHNGIRAGHGRMRIPR